MKGYIAYPSIRKEQKQAPKSKQKRQTMLSCCHVVIPTNNKAHRSTLTQPPPRTVTSNYCTGSLRRTPYW